MIYWVEVTEYLQRKIKLKVSADKDSDVVSNLLSHGGWQVEPAVITHLCQADIEFGLKEENRDER